MPFLKRYTHDKYLPLYNAESIVRGVVAQRLERKTLIHEVVGSNPAVVTLSVLPKGWGLDDSASSIGQAKSRFQLKSDLHLGKFHRADLVLEKLLVDTFW